MQVHQTNLQLAVGDLGRPSPGHRFCAPGISDGGACVSFPLGCLISLTALIISLFTGVSVVWLARHPVLLR